MKKEEFLKVKSELTEKADEINRHIANIKQGELAKQSFQKITSTAKTVLSGNITNREIVELLIDKIHVFPDYQIEIT